MVESTLFLWEGGEINQMTSMDFFLSVVFVIPWQRYITISNASCFNLQAMSGHEETWTFTESPRFSDFIIPNSSSQWLLWSAFKINILVTWMLIWKLMSPGIAMSAGCSAASESNSQLQELEGSVLLTQPVRAVLSHATKSKSFVSKLTQ